MVERADDAGTLGPPPAGGKTWELPCAHMYVRSFCPLGGCKNDDELTDGGTLVIDDDRTPGTGVLPITVFITLGSGTPTSVIVNAGASQTVTLSQGTYTVTFDDDGTSGATSGDTKEATVQVQTGKSTSVEYAGAAKTHIIGPNLQANG
jgi:hypothetical protein